VLNLRGRKSMWQWLGEVKLRDAMFLLRALRRTQRMMEPEHYLSEHSLAPPDESVVASATVLRATG
jgi:hypothetical protein